MNIAKRFATKEPTLCAVCHRHAVWLGYFRGDRTPVIWPCDDNNCNTAAKMVYTMPPKILDAYEIGAVLEAGAHAGSYLEKIGITDLTKLDADQWREFLRLIIVGFEQAMRRKILENEAPF